MKLFFISASCLSWVPEQGSVGASGDLAPLAHLALGLLGEGKMWSPETGWGNAKDVREGTPQLGHTELSIIDIFISFMIASLYEYIKQSEYRLGTNHSQHLNCLYSAHSQVAVIFEFIIKQFSNFFFLVLTKRFYIYWLKVGGWHGHKKQKEENLIHSTKPLKNRILDLQS
jgi:hypothetical protein